MKIETPVEEDVFPAGCHQSHGIWKAKFDARFEGKHVLLLHLLAAKNGPMSISLFFFFFSTGLVRLYIAGLPLGSCPRDPAAQLGHLLCRGLPNVRFFCFW